MLYIKILVNNCQNQWKDSPPPKTRNIPSVFFACTEAQDHGCISVFTNLFFPLPYWVPQRKMFRIVRVSATRLQGVSYNPQNHLIHPIFPHHWHCPIMSSCAYSFKFNYFMQFSMQYVLTSFALKINEIRLLFKRRNRTTFPYLNYF